MKSAFLVALVTLLTLPHVGTEALGETWPLRAVKLIVPLGPASGADVTARLLADRLSKRWGKTVVVENRPGADGIVGITSFLAGPPDDHVLLFAPTGTFTAYPFLHAKLSYDPDQLVPIARVTNTLISVSVPTAPRHQLSHRVDFVHSIATWPLSLGERDQCDGPGFLRFS